MKKYLLFILVLLVPFLVKAQDVKIKEVTLIDKSEEVDAEKHPTFEALKINFDLKLTYKDDYAKYKVIVENTSKKDYEIDDNTKYSDGEYIKYELTYEGSNIVKAGEEKEFLITITYNKTVPDDSYVNGKYTEKNSLTINLTQGDTSSNQQNPYTGSHLYTIVIIATVSVILLIISYKNRKYLACIMLTALLIPLTIYALEKISIVVDANIEISAPHPKFTVVFSCNSPTNISIDTFLPSEGYASLKYEEGMTFEDFMNSIYYQELDDITKSRISSSLIEKTYYDENFTKTGFRSYEYDTCHENASTTEEYNYCYYQFITENMIYKTEAIKGEDEGFYVMEGNLSCK